VLGRSGTKTSGPRSPTMMPQGVASLGPGAILLDQCTGKTRQLIRISLPHGGSTRRWFPIAAETTEATFAGQ
jgi:hypothetical protein